MTSPSDTSGTSPDQDTIVSWMGTPIEQLSREELVEAIRILGRQWKRSQQDHAQTLRMWEYCRRAR
jgi:hypothetical protein